MFFLIIRQDFIKIFPIIILGDHMTTKKLINQCKNYNQIVNYHYTSDDFITDSIINTYRNQIFSENPKIEKIKLLDFIILEYLNNINFKHFVKNYYLDETLNYFDNNDLKLVELYDKFKLKEAMNISNTKWI